MSSVQDLQFSLLCFRSSFPSGCKRHISKGHRFNAKKEDAGKYFSTKLFSFHTKCPNRGCTQKFVIKTDPKNSTYDYAEGIRKMEQDYETGDDDRVIKLATDETKQKLVDDAMFKLEYENDKKMKAESAKEQINSLIELNDAVIKRDYDINSELRRRNRQSKKKEKSLLELGKSIGLSIPLLESDDSDRKGALRAKFKPRYNGTFGASERASMVAIQEQSIFSSEGGNSGNGSNSSSSSSSSSRNGRKGSKSGGSKNDRSRESCKEDSILQKQARLMIKIGGVQDKEAISKDRPIVGSVFNVNNKGKRPKTEDVISGEKRKFDESSTNDNDSKNGNGLSLLTSIYDDTSD